jgi:hypothetical protein
VARDRRYYLGHVGAGNVSTPRSDDPTPVGTGPLGDIRAALLGVLLIVDFVVVVVMLATDKNLQTDFGRYSPYYAHWYGLLAMGVVDLFGALAVFGNFSRYGMRTMSSTRRRWVALAGLGWSVVAVLTLLGIVETYQQVGFSSMGQFAQYLFGVTASPGVLSYIPWLYDLLLAMYILTALVAALLVLRTRSSVGGSPTAPRA